MVHPHPVDSQLGQVRGDLLGVLVSGEVGAEAQVHAPDLQAAGPGEEMVVLDMHEAIRSGGLGRKPREVGRRRGGIVTGYYEGKPFSG